MRALRFVFLLHVVAVLCLRSHLAFAVRDENYNQQLLQLFDDLDKNHNGKIDTQEAISFLGESDSPVSNPDLINKEVNGKGATLTVTSGHDISPDELDNALHNILQGTRVWEWIYHSVGLPQYADAFRLNSITPLDFPILISNNGALLASELGITSVLHREKLVGAIKRLILAYGKLPGEPQDFSCSWGSGGPVLTWRDPDDLGHPPLHKYVVERLNDKTGQWVPVADTHEAIAVDADFFSSIVSSAVPDGARTSSSLPPPPAVSTAPRYRVVAWNLQGKSAKVEITCKSLSSCINSDDVTLEARPFEDYKGAVSSNTASSQPSSAMAGGGHDGRRQTGGHSPSVYMPSSTPSTVSFASESSNVWEAQEARRARAQSDRANVNSLLLMIFPWVLRLIPLKYLLQLRRLRLSRVSLLACVALLLRLARGYIVRFGVMMLARGPLRRVAVVLRLPIASLNSSSADDTSSKVSGSEESKDSSRKSVQYFLTASSTVKTDPSATVSSQEGVRNNGPQGGGVLRTDVVNDSQAPNAPAPDVSRRPPPVGGLQMAFERVPSMTAKQRPGVSFNPVAGAPSVLAASSEMNRSFRGRSGGDLSVRKGSAFFETGSASSRYSMSGANHYSTGGAGVLMHAPTTLGANTDKFHHTRQPSDPSTLGLSRANSLMLAGSASTGAMAAASASAAMNISHRGGSQRRLFCGFPGCEKKLDMLHYKDYKQKHYCGRCQQIMCLEHTAYSPHGPTGDCGYESRCTCVLCFPRFSSEYQAFLMQRNTLLPYQQRQQLKDASITFSGVISRSSSVRATQAAVVAAAGSNNYGPGAVAAAATSGGVTGDSLSGSGGSSLPLSMSSNYRSLPLLDGSSSAPSSPPFHGGMLMPSATSSTTVDTSLRRDSDVSEQASVHMGKMLWSRALYKLKAVIRLQKDGQKKKKNKTGTSSAQGSSGNLVAIIPSNIEGNPATAPLGGTQTTSLQGGSSSPGVDQAFSAPPTAVHNSRTEKRASRTTREDGIND